LIKDLNLAIGAKRLIIVIQKRRKMNFEVYCDESGLEALTKREAHLFTAIGGIWMPSLYRQTFKEQMLEIKEKNGIDGGELKWKKVSPFYVQLYSDIISYFFQTNELRFRVIVIESAIVNNIIFNANDAELGFYKFYYQLLNHWISDFNNYDIFLDFKVNRDKERLKVLNRVLYCTNLTSSIQRVQALPSHESSGIQLADILTGLVASKFNEEVKSPSKKQLIKLVETYLNKPIKATNKTEEKFNVFRINLKGGW